MATKYLEIGPGKRPLPGFETLNIVGNPTYRCDASKPLPLPDDTFDLIYASHVLEHIDWEKTVEVLREWVRVLRPGGDLEIWVPNGKLIAESLLNGCVPEKWCRANPERDPCKWASGRIFAYGPSHNHHRAFFTPNYLMKCLKQAGLHDCRFLAHPRGYDHGIINLGAGGTK